MHPSVDPTLTELRRWSIEQASRLMAKDCSIDDLTDAAECIEEWVLRDPDPEAE